MDEDEEIEAKQKALDALYEHYTNKYEALFDSLVKELEAVIKTDDRLAYMFLGEKFKAVYSQAGELLVANGKKDAFDPDEFRWSVSRKVH